MVTVSIATYPPESAKEVGKCFMELAPIPDFVKVDGPYLFPEALEGMQAITIYKYDRAKAADANEAITNAHLPFYEIPGFTFSLKLASGSATALKMLGLS